MEQEIKYFLPDEETAEKILDSHLVKSAATEEEPRIIEMNATYYDTKEGTLAANQVSYRLREENGVCVATIKTRGEHYGAMQVRGEWETPAVSEEPNVEVFSALINGEEGEQLASIVKLIEGKELLPVCGTDFVREKYLLDVGGACFELCIDRGELKKGKKRGRILELELELKKGDLSAMEEFGTALRDAFSLEAGVESKFARARSL